MAACRNRLVSPARQAVNSFLCNKKTAFFRRVVIASLTNYCNTSHDFCQVSSKMLYFYRILGSDYGNLTRPHFTPRFYFTLLTNDCSSAILAIEINKGGRNENEN